MSRSAGFLGKHQGGMSYGQSSTAADAERKGSKTQLGLSRAQANSVVSSSYECSVSGGQ